MDITSSLFLLIGGVLGGAEAFIVASVPALGYIVFFGVLIYYYANAFTSPLFKFLASDKRPDKIDPLMDNLYQKKPKIMMYLECFHYETRTGNLKPETGERGTSSSRERIITHTASKEFQYYSWRDVSGHIDPYVRDIMREQMRPYAYFDLSYDLVFANDGTNEDFEKERNEFRETNKKDEYQVYTESFVLEDFPNELGVLVPDTAPCTLNMYSFVFWTLIFFYLGYVNDAQNCWAESKAKITKVISTRKNLRLPEEARKFEYYEPRITLARMTTQFYPDKPPNCYTFPPGEEPFYAKPPPEDDLFVPINKEAEVPAPTSQGQSGPCQIVPISDREPLKSSRIPPPQLQKESQQPGVSEPPQQNAPMPVLTTLAQPREAREPPPKELFPEEQFIEDSFTVQPPPALPPSVQPSPAVPSPVRPPFAIGSPAQPSPEPNPPDTSPPNHDMQPLQYPKRAPEQKEHPSNYQYSPPGYSQSLPNYQQPYSGYIQPVPGYQQPPRGYQQTPSWNQPPQPGLRPGPAAWPYDNRSIEEIDPPYRPPKAQPPGASYRPADLNTSHLPLQYGQH